MDFFLEKSIYGDSSIRNLDTVVDYFESLYQRIENGDFEESSSEHMYYLSYIDGGRAYKILRGDEIEPEIDISDLRYSAFIADLTSTLRRDGNLQRFTEYGSEFEDRDLYPYFRSCHLVQTRFEGDWKEKSRQAIISGREAMENQPENFLVLYQFAKAGLLGIEASKGSSSIDITREELLGNDPFDEPITAVEKAIELHPEREHSFDSVHPPYITLSTCYALEAHLKALNGEIQAARAALGNSKQNYHSDWPTGDEPDFEILTDRIDSLELSAEIANFQDQIDKIELRIEDVRDELEDMTERFRSDIIQYIAFFAGVITVAVVSAQISQTATSFQNAARLILVFAGGLLISFGGFSFMVPYRVTRLSHWLRFLLIIFVGSALIVVGLDPFGVW